MKTFNVLVTEVLNEIRESARNLENDIVGGTLITNMEEYRRAIGHLRGLEEAQAIIIEYARKQNEEDDD